MRHPCLPAAVAAACTAAFVASAVAQPSTVPSTEAPGTQEPASAQPGALPGGGEEAAKEAPGFWERDTLTGNWGGLRTKLEDVGIRLGLQEQSEVWSNVSGGVRRGFTYDGLTTASLNLDLDKAFGWSGGRIFVSAFQIHGRGPTPNLVGNLQAVSSVEATRATRLYDLWLEQTFLNEKLSLRIGQEGANDEFMISQYGALFMNSSFGFPALAALDLPSGGPNYPLATPFVRLKYIATDQLTFMAGAYNGDPAGPGRGDPQERNASGTAFRLGDGVFAIAEVWYLINQDPHQGGLPGTYKLGGWYHSGSFSDQRFDAFGRSLADPASIGEGRGRWNNYAIYASADQMVWRKPGTETQGIGLFALAIGSLWGDRNLVDLSIIGGMNWKGAIPGRDEDVFGIGVAYLHISDRAQALGQDLVRFTGFGSAFRNNETVLEATYMLQVTPWWALQADLQYVANPGAGIPNQAADFTRYPLKNATILGLRSTILF